MNPVTAFFRWLRSFGQTRAVKQEIDEELRFHIEQRTAENIAAGISPEAAARQARRRFGNVQSVREQCREVRGASFGEATLRDVRFALRQLRKNPGFAAVAVLTLALGIGVNTSMFTALQSLLMRELPYPDAERLVQMFRTSPHSQRWPHAPANFLEQQVENNVFERMAAVNGKPFNLAGPGQPAERVRGMQASADFFPLLGVQPSLGRTFTADEDVPGRNNVVVLSYAFWLRRFAGDPSVVGRALRLDGETVTVVGVMPERFRDSMLLGSTEVWRPIAFTDAERQNRGGNYLKSVARLKPGVSLAQARAAMNLLAARQTREHPDTNSEIGLRLVPLTGAMDPRGQLIIWLTMVLAGFVLLIACANLANLQFARTARRAHELAIRTALGAARGRLLRQLLTESLVIAFFGGLLGLLLAWWGNQLLSRQLLVDGGENVLKLSLNLRVLGFALAASTIAGLAFGLVPAWLASRTDVNDALKQGSRGTTGDRSQHRLQHALIVAQVALALVLLTGAGLVVRGLHRFTMRDPGWRVDGLTLGYLSLPDSKYGGDGLRIAFAARLQEKLAALPGVERTALAWSLPISAFNTAGSFAIEGREWPRGHEPIRFVNGVTPGYFETLRMKLVTGRDFTAADATDRPGVVIINETMARTYWPGESPLGKRVDGAEIVGVVNDVRFPANPGEADTRYQTYRPFAQDPRGYLAVALRGNVTAETLRRAVAELDSDQPVNEPGLASVVVGRSQQNMAVGGRLFGGFAILGLLLASLGIYGVIAGFVAQRTNEIGVRMALGAQRRDVLWLVVGKGLRLTLLGVAVGLIGAFGIARLLANFVPGLESNDPLAIAFLTLLLVFVAMVACWIPARRAARVDPMVALRNE